MIFKRMSRGALVVLSLMLCILLSMFSVYADSNGSAQAQEALRDSVRDSLDDNEYEIEGGGYMKGSELFTKDETTNGMYDLDEGAFNSLTSSAQTELVSDIAEASYDAQETNTTITDVTIQDWWRELQSKDGVGSKFLNVVLENTKPDFVSANKIYKPFSGIVGTVMGLIAVFGMGLLGIVMVADIFYIVIPPVRMFVSDSENGDNGKLPVSKIFTNDAIYAVRVAEDSKDSSGSKKQALGVYLKRRIPMLILLGICLLYLVSGRIYTLVSWILDLVAGFI